MTLDAGSADDPSPQVTDLLPETISAVADRTAVALSFEELVYREAEIDALWTLVDIQVTQAEHHGSADRAKWLRMREILWEAHEHIAEERSAESAAALRSLLPLL